MVSAKMKSLVLLVIFVAILNCTGAQIGIPQIISLLNSVNDTTNTMASLLPHVVNSLRNQEANQNQTTSILGQMESSLKNKESVQNQTTMFLSHQLADSQIIMANAQAEMSRSLKQVVLILQGKWC